MQKQGQRLGAGRPHAKGAGRFRRAAAQMGRRTAAGIVGLAALVAALVAGAPPRAAVAGDDRAPAVATQGAPSRRAGSPAGLAASDIAWAGNGVCKPGVASETDLCPGSHGRSQVLLVARQSDRARLSAMRAADFIERQALAAHPHYTDSAPQANAAGMLGALRYLGIRNLRTEGPDPANQGQGTLNFLADNGIRFLFITGGDPAISLWRIREFLGAHPRSVALIEGINEPNNHPRIEYGGKTGLEAAVAFQTHLYALARNEPLLTQIPVAGMSSWPLLGAPSDLMNLHPYADWARQPRKAVEEAIRLQQATEDRPKGFVITEAGWHTLIGKVDGQYEGVDEQTQAKLVLNLIMDGMALGARYVTPYTLYDEYADPEGTNPLFHYGLFRFDGSPKPAATALHNLNEIFRDDGATAGSFTPGSLRVRVVPAAYRLLVQNSNGDHFLILWNEPDLWDDAVNVPIDPPDQATMVTFDCALDVAVFDPMTGTAPVRTARGVSKLQLALDGHPLVLRLTDRGRCLAATSPPR